MPTTTPKLGFTIPEDSDPADVPSAFSAFGADVEDHLVDFPVGQLDVPGGTGDDGKLVIVKDGAAAYAAMRGAATLAEDGTITLGRGVVGTNELADRGVTTAKLDDGAATAVKLASNAVEEAKIKDANVTSRKAALTAGVVVGGSDLVLTDREVDVPSASTDITAVVDSFLIVNAVFEMEVTTVDPDGKLLGQLSVGGSLGSSEAAELRADQRGQLTISQTFFRRLTGGVRTTVKLVGLKTGSAGGEIHGAFTRFTYLVVAQ